MLDIIWEKIKQILFSRLFPVTVIFLLLFAVLINRIFVLQIVNGDTYSEEAAVKLVKTREIKSTRGNIYDRNGTLLAYNKLTYNVVLEENTEVTSNDERNKMLYNLILILEKHGNTIENDFGISIDKDGKLYFNVEDTSASKSLSRFKKNAYGLKSIDDLTKDQKAATADEVFEFLRHGDSKSYMFNISDEYSKEDALKIMTLRYAIFTNYPKYNQIVVSSDVSDETVAAIYENSALIPGVEISQQTKRVYNDSIYNAHILGYTGLINEDELESLNKDTEYYNSSDVIGKMGIEKAFETNLAGTKGIENISVTASGKFLKVNERTDPIAGEDVYLTIDSDYQKAFYKIIERNLAGILLTKIVNSTDAGTRGTSAKNIKIPIYDVYFALINNNVIDIDKFTEEDATSLEKQVYQKFVNKQDDVLNDIEDVLALNSTTVYNEASEEMQDYLSYIYTLLKNNGVLLTKQIDSEDSTYLNYQDNKISLSKFLQYALSKNWIDLDKLDIGEEYYSTEELYEKLMEYLKASLKDDAKFHKMIYKDLVYSYNLTGTQICLLLFDQGVLKYNEEDISKLENGTISAYSFITTKIKNIEITPAQLALDPCSASVVVTDIKTGDVLAMVSYPSYDNNLYANKIDVDYYNKIYNDLSLPSMDRAAKQKTAPGSTYKMLTSIASLQEGVIGPTETVYDKTVFTKITPSPKDWSSSSHGAVNVPLALEVSCNYFFYEMGYRLGTNSSGMYDSDYGLKRLAKYAAVFGLDRKSGIEIEEAEPKISDTDAVRSAIGQGSNSYTPIQIARYLTAVASSGNLYDLTLLDKIVDKNGKVVVDNDAKYEKLTQINDSYWDVVHEGMYLVGNGDRSSSSYIFKDYPIEVAGKTGTAQESKSRPNHALFTSYAPYNDPEIAVTVVIPNGYASSNAVEVAKDIYSYYFNVEDKDKLVNGKALIPESESVTFTD